MFTLSSPAASSLKKPSAIYRTTSFIGRVGSDEAVLEVPFKQENERKEDIREVSSVESIQEHVCNLWSNSMETDPATP